MCKKNFFCVLKQLDHNCKKRVKEMAFYIVLDIISMVITLRLLCLTYIYGEKITSRAGKVAKENNEFKMPGLV